MKARHRRCSLSQEYSIAYLSLHLYSDNRTRVFFFFYSENVVVFFSLNRYFFFRCVFVFFPVQPHSLSNPRSRPFYIFLEVFAAESSFFVLKISTAAVAADVLGTFFYIFNIFFQLLIFFQE